MDMSSGTHGEQRPQSYPEGTLANGDHPSSADRPRPGTPSSPPARLRKGSDSSTQDQTNSARGSMLTTRGEKQEPDALIRVTDSQEPTLEGTGGAARSNNARASPPSPSTSLLHSPSSTSHPAGSNNRHKQEVPSPDTPAHALLAAKGPNTPTPALRRRPRRKKGASTTGKEETEETAVATEPLSLLSSSSSSSSGCCCSSSSSTSTTPTSKSVPKKSASRRSTVQPVLKYARQTQPAVKCGILLRQGRYLKRWKPRFYVLYCGRLFYRTDFSEYNELLGVGSKGVAAASEGVERVLDLSAGPARRLVKETIYAPSGVIDLRECSIGEASQVSSPTT